MISTFLISALSIIYTLTFIWIILNHLRWYSFMRFYWILSFIQTHIENLFRWIYIYIIHIFIYLYDLIQLTVYPYHFFSFYLNFYQQTLWTGFSGIYQYFFQKKFLNNFHKKDNLIKEEEMDRLENIGISERSEKRQNICDPCVKKRTLYFGSNLYWTFFHTWYTIRNSNSVVLQNLCMRVCICMGVDEEHQFPHKFMRLGLFLIRKNWT